MKRIAIVTSTRAEYGLLYPLIRKVESDNELELELIVTGAHLSKKQGFTIDEIYNDNIPIAWEIPILDDDNSAYGISVTMSNALKGFAGCFKEDRPDMLIVLGDRTEILSVVCAATNECIPIAHIHGGEITEGAVDNCIRHAITKMSHLHFTATDIYRDRVIQMGECPDSVFNVGALGTENILNQPLMKEDEIKTNIGIPVDAKYAVVTFHPVTMEKNTAETQANELCDAISKKSDLYFIITGANADSGGDAVNQIIQGFTRAHNNTLFIHSLGLKRYLSAVKYASFVLGNSSSGVIEAPVLGTPTVNIGDRQKGRLMADTVINCPPDSKEIIKAINEAENMEHKTTDLFGDGKTSETIVRIIKNQLDKTIVLKKRFYELKDCHFN